MKFQNIYWVFIILGIHFIHNGEACSETSLTATSYSQTFYSHSGYSLLYYDSNYEACWKIYSPDSTKIIELTTSYFYIESSSTCSYDYLRIYDSSSDSGSYLRKCGYKSSSSFGTIYSSGQNMYVKFKTDGSNQYRGFALHYKAVSSSNYDASQWSSAYSSSSSSSSDNFGAIYGGVVGGIFGFLLLVGGIIAVIFICAGANAANRGQRINRNNGRGAAVVTISQQQQQQVPPNQQPGNQYGMGNNNNAYQGAQPVQPPAFTSEPPPPYGQSAAYPPTNNSYPPPGMNAASGPGSESNYPPPPVAYY